MPGQVNPTGEFAPLRTFLHYARLLMGHDFWLELPVKGVLYVPVGNGFGVRVERG